MLRLLIYSVTSGFLVLLNTGIVDLANAQETSGRYVKTFVGNQSVTIDCIDETYDKKGDGSVWISVMVQSVQSSVLKTENAKRSITLARKSGIHASRLQSAQGRNE